MHKQLTDFMEEHVYPNEAELNRHQCSEHCWTPHPLVEQIKVELFERKSEICSSLKLKFRKWKSIMADSVVLLLVASNVLTNLYSYLNVGKYSNRESSGFITGESPSGWAVESVYST